MLPLIGRDSTDHQNRSDLLGSASSSTLQQRKPSTLSESPFAPSQSSLYQPNAPRDDFALREHTFLQESENNIDNYIAQGRAVLENLVEQRGMLKGTKRKLLDAANTLGMSRETIGWVERRTWVISGRQAVRPWGRRLLNVGRLRCGPCRCERMMLMNRTQDVWIFFGGAGFTLFSFWVIWHYLG